MLLRHRLLVMLLVTAGLPVSAASRHVDLDTWLADDLVVFVRQQLLTHPRFRGESLRFVVLANGSPQPSSNALALRIRDRLREAAADVPGIRIAWQPDDPHYLRNPGSGGIDCTKGEVHYLIGVEMNLVESGILAVEVRALDVEDRTVVAGFSKSWQGPVSSRHYREFRRLESDPTFRGEREVPYEDSQTDLLAAHLAHDLGCNLLRQTDAEYVLSVSGAGAPPEAVNNMVELVSNNLAQYSTLQFATTDDSANSAIEGKAHKIDEDLYQYWITVRANDPDSDLQVLSASAYIRLPEQFAATEPVAGPPDPGLHNNAAFLTSLQIVTLRKPKECVAINVNGRPPGFGGSYADNAGDCFALQVQASEDAVVFFLNHQLNNGLVRLADPSCPQRSSARVARNGENLNFALPPGSLPMNAWSAGAGWQLRPGLDTYYAVAATDTRAARALSRHIEQLPKRCSGSVRPGLEGFALQRWMQKLAEIVDHWEPAIDWQTIRVKNVY